MESTDQKKKQKQTKKKKHIFKKSGHEKSKTGDNLKQGVTFIFAGIVMTSSSGLKTAMHTI